MTWLLALATVVILAFGRWRGITSLIGLAVSFAILLLFVIPAAALGGIDMRGWLLAGIVIGALGVLDDVTVTQAATVAEMAQAGPMSRLSLYRAASRVGRAHVASAVNTIVLAYAGASLPLLLLVATSTKPVSELLTSEFLAQEVLRSAVGTIGLVASVPIATALAALVADLLSHTGAPRDGRRRSSFAAHR